MPNLETGYALDFSDSSAMKSARRDAYRIESDPLFFKVQRGEIDQQEWLNKIEEIKERFPIPF